MKIRNKVKKQINGASTMRKLTGSWNQLSMSMCDAYVSAIAKTGQYDERT